MFWLLGFGIVTLSERYIVSILEILSPSFRVSKPIGSPVQSEHTAVQLLVRSLIRKKAKPLELQSHNLKLVMGPLKSLTIIPSDPGLGADTK